MENKFWIGIVENKQDPESRGRIQVRILGIHTKESVRYPKKGIGIETEELPWAVCCMPLTFGGVAESTVPPPAVMPGAWVLGITLDGDAYQKLLVLGVISLALSPLVESSADLGLSQDGYQQVNLKGVDSCKEKYAAAIKNMAKNGNDISANNMAMVLQYLKQKEPQKYNNFVKNSGIELNTDTVIAQSSNSAVTELLSEGYYDYCMDSCGDPVLAALAFKCGYGKAISGYDGNPSYIQKYGDPRKKEISYEDFAKKIMEEDPESAYFMNGFISELGEDALNTCVYGTTSSSPTGNSTSVSSEGTTTSTNTSDSGLKEIALPTNSNVITSIFKSPNRPNYSISKPGQHFAIDIRAPSGSPIRSMAEGTVIQLIPKLGAVLIDHGSGIKTRYLHMRNVYVKTGEKVKVGQQIGESGNKGLPQCTPHLHFEVWENDTKIDPEKFLTENGITMTRKAGA